MSERVNPIRVEVEGESFTLEFSRETVRFAENRGFNIEQISDFPQTNIPALWFYAFRKNHKNISREKTDKILERMGGLTEQQIVRLVELYQEPNRALIADNEEQQKNAGVTVEL